MSGLAHDARYYADQISASWRQSVEGIFSAGRWLVEAKASLPHGEYEAMVEGMLPFGKRAAQMLAAVATDPRLENANHGSHLPSSWRTLYELTRLDDVTLERAFEDGTIRPDMQRKHVVNLRQQVTNPKPEWSQPEEATADLQTLIDRGRKYACIYADPPWQYGNQGTRAATDNHYPTMTTEDIARLPIDQLVDENAHLHLWTTNAFLFESQMIMESWGFEYKSVLVWVKPQMGIGNYWRVSHEFLLLGVRGSAPFLDRSCMSWVSAERGRHSSKPDAVRKMIERVSPGPRLELFARIHAQGWSAWGNEIGVRDDIFTTEAASA